MPGQDEVLTKLTNPLLEAAIVLSSQEEAPFAMAAPPAFLEASEDTKLHQL